MWQINCGLLLLAASVAQATLQIVPGATWTATNTGKHIQAHGAGVVVEGSTYYLLGENKTSGSAFQSIPCYSSTDLVQWKLVNDVLRLQDSGDLGPSRVVERPKVLKNSRTGQYVMYLHIDSSSYGEAKVGVAVSDSVCGNYTYIGSWRPLGFQSRDIGLFQDDDGTGYLLTEDRVNGLRIDRLTDDYLNVSSATHVFSDIEAPAMIKKNGVYFMFGSHLSGWDANDNVYSVATNISGPWSSWTTFATVGSKTYNSQTNYILPFGDAALYLGDRWVSSNLMRSTYVWLPLQFASDNATAVSMANYVNWVPNAAAGTWSAGPSETWLEAENATISGGAKVATCSGCSGGSAVGYIGGSTGGTLTFANVSSTATTTTTVRIKHLNGDSSQRFATVTVNGQAQKVAFLPTGDGQTPGSSSVHCQLNKGTANTIVISTSDGSYGPDVDRIMVPVS